MTPTTPAPDPSAAYYYRDLARELRTLRERVAGPPPALLPSLREDIANYLALAEHLRAAQQCADYLATKHARARAVSS